MTDKRMNKRAQVTMFIILGVILLAGGPVHVVSAFEAALKLMFGDISSELGAKFSELEQQITAVESITFNEEFESIQKTPEIESTNDANNVSKICSCTQSDETVYTFDDNFNATA